MKSRILILSVVAGTIFNQPVALSANENKNSKQQVMADSQLEFFPVKFSETGGKGTLNFESKHLVKLSKSINISLNEVKSSDQEMGLINFELQINDKKAKEFDRLTRNYLNYRLAVVYKGRVILAPLIRETLNHASLKFTLKHDDKNSNFIRDLVQV